MGKGQTLYRKACRLIPGGTQLLSKRPEMFLPDQWPAYYASAKGITVTDLDGVAYRDFSHCGVGTCPLGYADPDVNAAVVEAVSAGSMCTLNAPEEVALAELLIELHPWAEMARFGRSGGEMMSVAIRIARAATGRSRVAFCGYHGWHDWYIAANLATGDALGTHLIAGLQPDGVPVELKGTAHPFHYNTIEELEEIVGRHGGELAAIVLEPVRSQDPADDFLAKVKEVAAKCGAVLIFDEITSGWRIANGGAHLTMGIEPDMAVFAKAISNGYAMAAVIGRRAVMDAAQKSFISSTYWTERVGVAAALACIRKYGRENVAAHQVAVGERVRRSWLDGARSAGIEVHVDGLAPLSHLAFVTADPAAATTLYTQEMLTRGFLAGAQCYTTFAHRDEDIDRHAEAAAESMGVIARALASGDVRSALRGPVKHTGFQRLN
ncbi:MAG: aminotransferase class III-fold pyridoxal phosphate-dependent enzyme [Pseudomonadota bacterium]